jgi:hypothetical protein
VECRNILHEVKFVDASEIGTMAMQGTGIKDKEGTALGDDMLHSPETSGVERNFR